MSCARCGSTISPVRIQIRHDGWNPANDVDRELCRACAVVIATMLRAHEWVPKRAEVAE